MTDEITCRGCNNSGRDLEGWPCSCGCAPTEQFTRSCIGALVRHACEMQRQRTRACLEKKAGELFVEGKDGAAKAVRGLVKEIGKPGL